MFINYFYSRWYVWYHDFKISFNKLRACIHYKSSLITMQLVESSMRSTFCENYCMKPNAAINPVRYQPPRKKIFRSNVQLLKFHFV